LEKNCVICRKPVEDESQAVKCVVCGVVMHKSCASDEALLDAEENALCPYDAMMAALDWFDAVILTYANTLNDVQKNDVIERLRSYTKLLEGKETSM
jgi:hypothetical protein